MAIDGDDAEGPVEWMYAHAERRGLSVKRVHELFAQKMGLSSPDHARRRFAAWKADGSQPWPPQLAALSEILEIELSVVSMKFRQQTARRSIAYVQETIPGKDWLFEKMSGDLERRGWSCVVLDKGQGCTKREFNRELVVSPPDIRLMQRSERWLARGKYPDDLLPFVIDGIRVARGEFRNDTKIRIASDFVGRSTVEIQETDYLSSLMTDQLGWARVRSEKLRPDLSPQHVLRDVSSFVDPVSGRLQSFGDNLISNQVAASTLAFSRDGYLMIVAQNAKNLQSQSFLAPSGSGSLDWADVALSAATDLLSLIRFGAQRELQEECALDDVGGRRVIASRVMVTGFARMLHRAGKPEFFCLGCIDAPAADIRSRKPERYVDRVAVAPAAPANWQSCRPSVEIARVCKSYLSSQRHISFSYPLEHALILLTECCLNEASAQVVDRFVREKFGN